MSPAVSLILLCRVPLFQQSTMERDDFISAQHQGRGKRCLSRGNWLLIFPFFFLSLTAAHAAGTSAGTSISNTASATYTDPNNAGQTLNATSNTVSVTVAEVAGITVTGSGTTDTTRPGTNILPGDVVNYDYTVTNSGNAANTFVLPGSVTVTGPGTAGSLLVSTDGGSTYTTTVPAGGYTTGSIAANASIRVRVPVTFSGSASTGNSVAVLLGNTGANDNSAGTQNVAYPDSHTGGDVHTTSTSAQNGTREASGTQSATVGSQPQSFSSILLTRGTVTQGATPANDVLTYNVGLNVNSSPPTGASSALIAADLAGTPISVNSATVTRVLISNAIPANTVLTGTPVAPTGWTVVYTTTPTTTDGKAAAWTTTAPALNTVTRVGYVNAGPITKGTSLTGFSYQVQSNGASSTTTTTIANITQLFGQSSGDTSNAILYDESGDQAPSDFNDDGSRGPSASRNTSNPGVANPSVDGTDPSNNNTGTGAGGQDNVYNITPNGQVLNGPNGQPGAIGGTNNNDDFTNESAPVPAGTAPGSTLTPASVTFTNTVNNPGTTALTNPVILLPQSPSTLPGGAATDLPSGARVTLTQGANTAVYTYNGTTFSLTSGTAISIANLAAGASVNYTTTVALPAGTPLSTDTGKGFTAPVLAFIDSNGNGVLDAGESSNSTVDRVYTGFLQVNKQARIVDVDGTTVIQNYTTTPTSSNLQPGRFVDYQITYTNISSAPGGTGNVTLSASNLVITEDGTTGGNTWALDQDSNGIIDTSNVVGTAVDSGSGTITYFSGNPATTSGTDRTGTTAATDVSKYVDTVSSTVTPGTAKTFTFRRKIN